MVLAKGNLQTNTDRATRVSTEHVATQADDIYSVLDVPKCNDKLSCILFLLRYLFLRETN